MAILLKNKELEKEIEKRIRTAYKEKDYIRCYNLMNLMFKINKNNLVLKNYVTKLDEKKIEKYRRKWWLSNQKAFWEFIKSPRVLFSLLIATLFGGLN